MTFEYTDPPAPDPVGTDKAGDPKPTGGTFTLHMGGHISAPIPYDADIDVLRAAVEEIVIRTRDEPGIVSVGGWCAPSEAVYDLFTLPDINIARDGSPYSRTPVTPPPPPTLRQRIRRRYRDLRQRLHAVRYAVRKAWKYPDGYWEVD